MIDETKVQQAVKLLLEAIGEDTSRDGLVDTPKRISEMCKEIFGGLGKDASEHLSVTFQAEGNGIVMEKEIPFYSVCEHHLVPFFGKAYIAYIPDGRVVGLSKLARAVETYARRPQIQEQLTTQVADSIMDHLMPKGVMVLMEAEHLCMSMRGVNKPGTKTVTFVCRGVFEDNQALQTAFFQMMK